jgi:ribosomal protein S18 acetylase RimI-like enzyme
MPHSLQTNSRTENQQVIAFYQRRGFVEVARKSYDNRVDMMMFRFDSNGGVGQTPEKP